MARPVNTEMKTSIMEAAWQLFCQQGYDATTYAAIAQACGISRNLVQYHYPKKELLAFAYMEHILGQVQATLGYHDDNLGENITAVHEVGSCFFTYLLQDEGRRTFLVDILRNRDLTEATLTFDAQWALSRMRAVSSADHDTIMRTVMVYMGGFYELLYYCLVNNQPINPTEELQPVLAAFAAVLGFDKEAVKARLKNNAPSAERVEAVVQALQL